MKHKKIIVALTTIVLIFTFSFLSFADDYTDIPICTSVSDGVSSVGFYSGFYDDYFSDGVSGAKLYYVIPNQQGDKQFNFNFTTSVVPGDIATYSIDFYCLPGCNPEVFLGYQLSYVGGTITRLGAVNDGPNENTWYKYRCSGTINYTNYSTWSFIVILRGSSVNQLVLRSFNFSCKNDPSYSIGVAQGNINEHSDYNANNIMANNNSNAAAINEYARQNTDDIKSNQDRNTQRTIDEEYGYEKPDSSGTDDGIESGGNLLDSLTEAVEDFNDTVTSSTDNLLNSLTDYKTVVHSIFNVLPIVVQYLVVFSLTFLVIRKVVGR